MARTFRAEGRQLAYLLRTLFVTVAVLIYFAFPDLHWGFLCGFIAIGVVIAEIVGELWTRYRREQKQSKKKNSTNGKPKTTSMKTTTKAQARRQVEK